MHLTEKGALKCEKKKDDITPKYKAGEDIGKITILEVRRYSRLGSRRHHVEYIVDWAGRKTRRSQKGIDQHKTLFEQYGK